jgi:capsular exopolysaccharide synthesis family protein
VQQDSEGLNFGQALGTLRRRAPLILLCFVLAAAAAFGVSKRQTKKYTATASLVFGTSSLSQQIAGLSTSGGSGGSLTQQTSNVELVGGGDTAARTASLLGRGLTEEAVSESVSIAGQGESSVVDVSATATSPVLAAYIANTYTHQFVDEQRSTNGKYFRSALALVNRQLAKLSPAQRLGQDGLALEGHAQTLSLLKELHYNDVQVSQEASPPTSPTSPKTSRNTALGGLLGLLIGLGLAFALEGLDRRIKGPEDLEAIYRLPLLGEVTESAALGRSPRRGGAGRAALPPAEAEAFSLIRAHLRFFNIDRELRTILIASPAPGDGKTTIARGLAEAAARLGSRVLLAEVDLRHPTLGRQLDIQSGPGVADVLIDTISMRDAMQSVAVGAAPGEGVEGRMLDVLVAGAVLPPNPGELLESRAMDAVLEQAKSAYDLVVIDTPPLTAVSDAFPLLTRVDGVVIVGRVGHSRRDAAERLHRILSSSGAPLLGVIANSSKAAGSYAYAYAENPKSSSSSSSSSSVAASDNGASASGNGSASDEFIPTVKT